DPTICIHSGHGLQVYWVFKEMWELDTPAERTAAQGFLRRIKQYLRFKAEKHDWVVDPVQDLVRIMRVPESFNSKEGDKLPVKILEYSGVHWDPGDCDDILPDDPGEHLSRNTKLSNTSLIHATANELVLCENPLVPPGKFVKLNDIFGGQFKGAWDESRQDLKDKSTSGYDQALANMATQAGWTAQEIAYLMIAHRQECGHELKLHNKQYYSRTILSAKEACTSESLVAEATNRDMAFAQKMDGLDTSDKLNQISSKLKLKINKILKYDGDLGHYILETEKGAVELGPVENLNSQAKLLNRISDSVGHCIPTIKPKEWSMVRQLMHDVRETIAVSPDSTLGGQIASWLNEFFINEGDRSFEDICENISGTRRAFTHQGFKDIFLSHFMLWVRTRKHPGYLTDRQVSRELKKMDCEYREFNVYVDDGDGDGEAKRRTKLSVWKINPGILN
ncbi:MAG: hypothetical protein K8R46_08995, partial [Pirellulales bacterium]|nr:hypothetical protein [Pirellulales bacterium]